MKIRIRGIGIISAQATFDKDNFLNEIVHHEGNRLNVVDPPYKEILNPRLMRRMTKIIKMGVTAAKICLNETDIEKPDAIITGTAMGCVKDTETFLLAYGSEESTLLTPTAFIRSTHNTVGAQIGLLLKCNHYNFTYVHRGFSFESALLDAVLKLKEGEGRHMLVGAVDEMTDTSYQIKSHLGKLKNGLEKSTDIFTQNGKGVSAGEGAAYFLLSSTSHENDYAELSGLFMIYKPKDQQSIQEGLQHVLFSKNMKLEDLDAVVIGKNGDETEDKIYDQFVEHLPQDIPILGYKHLSGEYETSSAFALWMASRCIKEQRIPDAAVLEKKQIPSQLRHILIYNHYRGVNHTFMMVSECID